LELRQARANSWSIPDGDYRSLQHIQRELLYSRKLSRDMNWQQIEVAGKSVEEVAREIILLLSDTKGGSGPAW
jgi:regulator of PEP synthase PpsR (kinase-PPPase family)